MDYREENRKENEHVRIFLSELSPAQWQKSISHEKSVGTILCHMAFWDRMCSYRIQEWIKTGKLPESADAICLYAINDSVRYLSLSIDFTSGKELVLSCMEEIDGIAARLTPEQQRSLVSAGRERWLNRSFHRKTHMEQIEIALAQTP